MKVKIIKSSISKIFKNPQMAFKSFSKMNNTIITMSDYMFPIP